MSGPLESEALKGEILAVLGSTPNDSTLEKVKGLVESSRCNELCQDRSAIQLLVKYLKKFNPNNVGIPDGNLKTEEYQDFVKRWRESFRVVAVDNTAAAIEELIDTSALGGTQSQGNDQFGKLLGVLMKRFDTIDAKLKEHSDLIGIKTSEPAHNNETNLSGNGLSPGTPKSPGGTDIVGAMLKNIPQDLLEQEEKTGKVAEAWEEVQQGERKLELILPEGKRVAKNQLVLWMHLGGTVGFYIRTRKWCNARMEHEAKSLARALDLLIDQFGLEIAGNINAVETLVRRLGALEVANKSNGSWEVAKYLEEGGDEGVMSSTLDSALKVASRMKKLSKGVNQKGVTPKKD